MDSLDNITTLAKLAQSLLGALHENPLAAPDLTGKPEPVELSHAADLGRVEQVRLLVTLGA